MRKDSTALLCQKNNNPDSSAGSGDLIYIGRERRVCSDVAKLGVDSLRAPYGLDDDVWGKALII